jgi:uroporphyrinogen decarboxylase
MPRLSTAFEPDYRHLLDAAGNRRPARVPLYDHLVNVGVQEKILGREIEPLLASDDYADLVEGYRRQCAFGLQIGYDAISVEHCVTRLVQGSQGLCGRAGAIIHNLRDLEQYPWAEFPARYIKCFDAHFRALAEALPPGMKAVGGIGNGIFETVQDFVPLMELPFLMVDEPEAYALLWQRVGDIFAALWAWFLPRHGDAYAVCRMGDDLGYRSSTMLKPEQIRQHIIPQYKRVVDLVHAHNKKFLLHSCGRIFDVMEDMIGVVGIDAKHSNEDTIAPFQTWLDQYNDRIAVFGGIDMDLLCRATPDEIAGRTRELLELTRNYRGFAVGCGNSIADYVPVENYLAMTEAARDWRGA